MADRISQSYRPTEDEPYMNEQQRAYFRRKLLNWKTELMAGSRDTIEGLQDSTRNIPDVADRASEREPAPSRRVTQPVTTRPE